MELVNISINLKADQKYVSEVIIDETLQELEFPDLFTRVHRNGSDHIVSLEKDAKGQIGVRMLELVDVSGHDSKVIRRL